MPDTRFRDRRWTRAGASATRLTELRAAHAALSPEEQAAEATRIDTVSDRDLRSELAAHVEDLTAGTVEEVLANVGDDPELAAVALAREQGKTKQRSSLIDALRALIPDPTPDA